MAGGIRDSLFVIVGRRKSPCLYLRHAGYAFFLSVNSDILARVRIPGQDGNLGGRKVFKGN